MNQGLQSCTTQRRVEPAKSTQSDTSKEKESCVPTGEFGLIWCWWWWRVAEWTRRCGAVSVCQAPSKCCCRIYTNWPEWRRIKPQHRAEDWTGTQLWTCSLRCLWVKGSWVPIARTAWRSRRSEQAGTCSWWCRSGCCGPRTWSPRCVSPWGSACTTCAASALLPPTSWCSAPAPRSGYSSGRCVSSALRPWADAAGIPPGAVKWERMAWEPWPHSRLRVACWTRWLRMGHGWPRSGSRCRMRCGGCSLLLASGSLLCARCSTWSRKPPSSRCPRSSPQPPRSCMLVSVVRPPYRRDSGTACATWGAALAIYDSRLEKVKGQLASAMNENERTAQMLKIIFGSYLFTIQAWR